MSELTDKLKKAVVEHYKGTELGNLLTWAAMHIESQDEALSDLRVELTEEEAERMKLEAALHLTKSKMQEALECLTAAWCPPVELGRDLAPHINLMRAHGDPDYTTKSGQSVRHIDTRTDKPKTQAKRKKAVA